MFVQSLDEVRRTIARLMPMPPTSSDSSGAGNSSNSSATPAGSSNDVEKPKANDISHLIKRKKPDTSTDSVEESASPAKKPNV